MQRLAENMLAEAYDMLARSDDQRIGAMRDAAAFSGITQVAEEVLHAIQARAFLVV